MNEMTFIRLLNRLDDADWQAVIEGQGILVVDDLLLQTGPTNAPNAIIYAPEEDELDADTLKRESIDGASALLNNYYLSHLLTLPGFNYQAQKLIEEHGAAAFVAPEGQLPEYTLFVDGGEVIAEPPDSPRHRYGTFCELTQPLTDLKTEEHVRKWLERGEAYERYLGMNVPL
ncbi:MAG: hypothetical protein EP297_11380 [Gammaproteobacteria bacterium]|nr:MAG: hypothetical protein EP297_11380 [Gammaproteobacteria bacterium]